MKRGQYLKVVLLLFLSCEGATAATNITLTLRYARLYERELAGEQEGLEVDYQTLFADARGVDKEFAEKALYRLGVYEKKAGRLEQARAAWRNLTETFPLSDSIVLVARDALKVLEWEMDRIPVSGRVISPERGKCIIFAGEWGNEPPVLTGLEGDFHMKRRAAGQLPDGRSYGLVFAEHVSRPLVGAEVWMGIQSTGLTVTLASPVTLAGWVVDQAGIPVAEARIRIVGFKMTADPVPGVNSGMVSHAEYPIPLPLDRLIPSVFSGTNGTFIIEGLPPGLRYVLTPERAEYRVVLKQDVAGFQGVNSVTFGCSNNLTVQQLSNLYVNIDWIRESTESGAPLRWEDCKGHIVVFHFGSAYREASLRAQYPEEGCSLSPLTELYGDLGVICIWVLPEGEGKGEVAQLALGIYPDVSIGAIRKERFWNTGSRTQNRDKDRDGAEFRGNVVMGRDGRIMTMGTDQQVFRAVKRAVGEALE